jgi:hypothetical protein
MMRMRVLLILAIATWNFACGPYFMYQDRLLICKAKHKITESKFFVQFENTFMRAY